VKADGWVSRGLSVPSPVDIQLSFPINKLIQLVTYEKDTSIVPKIPKLCMVKYKFKRNIFPFGKKFKFPT
jgi:hypothetical protein